MKITKSKLAQIVQEELSNTMSEAEQWKMGRSMKAADLAADPLYAAENQGIVDAQDDFMRHKRGEEVSPDLPSFGSAEEEEAYGMAWGKEWHRLMDIAAKNAVERKLNRPPAPMTDADREAADAELDFEATYSEGKTKITKSKLAQIVQEELTNALSSLSESEVGMSENEAYELGREDAVEVWRGEMEAPRYQDNPIYMKGFKDQSEEIAAEEGEDSLQLGYSPGEVEDNDWMRENKITKSKLAQIVQEELKAVTAEGYKAYKRDELGDENERIYPKRTLSRHAKDMAKNIKKGYSPQAAVTAIPDNEEVDKAYYDSLNKKPKRESQLSESDVEPIEAGQDERIQEFIYQQIADNLQDGPLPADSILSLTEPEYESPREHLADQWEDILAAALHEMSEGDDATIEKSHDTMTGEPYYSPIGFLS